MKDEVTVYDDMFSTGGYEGVYDLPYKYQCYYPLFKKVLCEVNKLQSTKVLEVGCGTGSFGHILRKKTNIEYKGFDFSHVAVEKAKRKSKIPSDYFVGDATDPKTYAINEYNYDCIVCTEVLEHIENDLTVIENWKSQIPVIFSIPNFDSKYHVRYFKTEKDVFNRYKDVLSIKEIEKIKKPYLSNIHWKNRVQHFIWNRYQPRKLLNIAGLGSFNIVGGWFLVIGEKI